MTPTPDDIVLFKQIREHKSALIIDFDSAQAAGADAMLVGEAKKLLTLAHALVLRAVKFKLEKKSE